MGREETRERRPVAADPTGSSDGDVIDDLAAFERNTISRSGRVVGTLVVDYAAASVSDVRSSVVSTVAEAESASREEARSRLVDSSRELLARAHPGVQAIVLVRLPSGDVFADRIPVPERSDLETPETRRHERFVDAFGDVESVAQLEGERVPIEYDASAKRWRIDCGDADGGETGGRPTISIVRRIGVYGLFSGLFAYGWVALGRVSTEPTIGAIGPQSLLLASMLLLLVGFGLDLVRSAIELTERSTAIGG